MNKVNLRVFKRSEDIITLFWDIHDLTEDQKQNVKIFLIEKQNEANSVSSQVLKEMVFVQKDPQKDFNTKRNDVGIGVLGHSENGIDKDDSVLLKMVLGTTTKTESFLRVSPCGVLPFYEKDNKSQNSHMLFWDAQKKKWGKMTMVKLEDGTFALPVVVVSSALE